MSGATHLRATQSQIVCISCKLAAAKITEQNSQGERASLAFLLMQALPLPQEAPEEAGRDAGCHKCKSFCKVVVCSVLGVCMNPVTRPFGECPVTVAQLMVHRACIAEGKARDPPLLCIVQHYVSIQSDLFLNVVFACVCTLLGYLLDACTW